LQLLPSILSDVAFGLHHPVMLNKWLILPKMTDIGSLADSSLASDCYFSRLRRKFTQKIAVWGRC